MGAKWGALFLSFSSSQLIAFFRCWATKKSKRPSDACHLRKKSFLKPLLFVWILQFQGLFFSLQMCYFSWAWSFSIFCKSKIWWNGRPPKFSSFWSFHPKLFDKSLHFLSDKNWKIHFTPKTFMWHFYLLCYGRHEPSCGTFYVNVISVVILSSLVLSGKSLTVACMPLYYSQEM